MAQPIEFAHPLRNPHAELYQQLQNAPQEHVEALLDVYAILQLLHDKGLLEIVKDTLGSGEKVLGILTETMETNEVVRTIRNLIIFLKLIGSVEPEILERAMSAVSSSLEAAKEKEPPTLLHLFGQLRSQESRRALAPVAAALQAVGSSLPQVKETERKRTSRHSA